MVRLAKVLVGRKLSVPNDFEYQKKEKGRGEQRFRIHVLSHKRMLPRTRVHWQMDALFHSIGNLLGPAWSRQGF